MHLTGNNILAFTKYLLQIVFWPQSTKITWTVTYTLPQLWNRSTRVPVLVYAKENNASYLDIFTFVLTDIPATQIASLFKRWVSGTVLAHGHGVRVATTGRDDTPVHGVFEGLSCGEADEAVAAFNSEVEWAADWVPLEQHLCWLLDESIRKWIKNETNFLVCGAL